MGGHEIVPRWARNCAQWARNCAQWARNRAQGVGTKLCPVGTKLCPVGTKLCPGHFLGVRFVYDLLCLSFFCRYLAFLASDVDLSAFSSICRRHNGHTWLRSQIGRYQADRLLLQLPPYFYWPRRVNEKCRYDICTWLDSQIGQYQVRQISKTSNISDYNWNNFYRKQLYLTQLANRPIPGKTAAKDRR